MKENKRSIEMWKLIDSQVDSWFDKVVIDVGCGYGNMVYNVLKANCHQVVAIDNNKAMIDITKERCKDFIPGRIMYASIDAKNMEEFVRDIGWKMGIMADIYFCFSMLPYLPPHDRERLIETMSRTSNMAFIEMQYAGDGPGPKEIKNDADMYTWLRTFNFGRIDMIGTTHVEGRNTDRSIWLCERRI